MNDARRTIITVRTPSVLNWHVLMHTIILLVSTASPHFRVITVPRWSVGRWAATVQNDQNSTETNHRWSSHLHPAATVGAWTQDLVPFPAPGVYVCRVPHRICKTLFVRVVGWLPCAPVLADVHMLQLAPIVNMRSHVHRYPMPAWDEGGPEPRTFCKRYYFSRWTAICIRPPKEPGFDSHDRARHERPAHAQRVAASTGVLHVLA